MNTEPIRDPELAALLRSATPQPPMDDVDWEHLRGVANSRAELPLARLRTPARRPRVRAWLPLGAAAGIAASLVFALRPAPVPGPLPAEERRIVDAIVAESLPTNVDQLLSGAAAEGMLLAAVVGS
ncbi:MAG TPA: hypothetical protein VF584_19085 [Longimicrobium sp.]|jgi:hypothetical protein